MHIIPSAQTSFHLSLTIQKSWVRLKVIIRHINHLIVNYQ